MRFIKMFSFLFFVMALGIISCDKENIDVTDIETDPVDVVNSTTNNLLSNIRSSGDEGMELDCITILYTFEFLLADGSHVSISTDDEFYAIMEDSINNAVIDFIYPLDVVNANEETVSVNNAIELGELFIACIPDDGWVDNSGYIPAYLLDGSCFTVVYPVELLDYDGNEFVAANVEEFIDLRSTNQYLFFNWPLELIGEDGQAYELNNVNEYFELMLTCESYTVRDSLFFNGVNIACYELVYPLAIVNGDSEEVTFQDADEFITYVFNGNTILNFVFPLSLIDEDGETHLANSEGELDALVLECFGDGPGFNQELDLFIFSTAVMRDSGCYSLVYPISIQLADSTTSLLNSDEEVNELFNINEYFIVEYPVSITIVSDETIVVLNELNDLYAVLDGCGE